MTEYEKVMTHLRSRCNEIMGEWDGDEPGEKEDRVDGAEELLELLDEVNELVEELDI